MNRVRTSSPRRSRLFGFALALVAVAQFVVVAIAPYVDARAGQSAREHVELAGTSRHYSHNRDGCAGCVAQQIGGTVVSRDPLPVAISSGEERVVASSRIVARARQFDPASPRAPPPLS